MTWHDPVHPGISRGPGLLFENNIMPTLNIVACITMVAVNLPLLYKRLCMVITATHFEHNALRFLLQNEAVQVGGQLPIHTKKR